MNLKPLFDARDFSNRDFDVNAALDRATPDPFYKLRQLCNDFETNDSRTEHEKSVLSEMILKEKRLLVFLGYQIPGEGV